jgi:4'-phosphopantetheinyl transferase EntD
MILKQDLARCARASGGAGRARAAAALARTLFGPGVAVAGRAIGDAPPPWPEEAAALARPVPARRAEFAAGRAAARDAMAALGLPPLAVPMGADRAPVWPPGLAGSITHADGIALAAVARSADIALLGLDAEPDAPLPRELWDEVLRPEERAAAAAAPDPGRAARLVFAAKEAAYKAQHPRSGRLLGFGALAVTLGPGAALAATFAEPAPPFRPGDRLDGRAARGAGLLLAGVSRRA